MAHARSAAHRPPWLPSVSPLCSLACGLLLMAGGGLLYVLERDPPAHVPTAADEAAAAEMASARALQRVREREARARAEMERKEAEERARRTLLVDGPRESEARNQREEFARRQAASVEAQRAEVETEEAWKRFYKPSAECRDPAASTRIECVNEYVKAKRDFQARMVARPN
jgi:hypothetical protein